MIFKILCIIESKSFSPFAFHPIPVLGKQLTDSLQLFPKWGLDYIILDIPKGLDFYGFNIAHTKSYAGTKIYELKKYTTKSQTLSYIDFDSLKKFMGPMNQITTLSHLSLIAYSAFYTANHCGQRLSYPKAWVVQGLISLRIFSVPGGELVWPCRSPKHNLWAVWWSKPIHEQH